MENLIFSLNATMPIFLLMVLGYIFNQVGIFDEVFAARMNKFVFKIALPVMLFQELSIADFSESWDTKFVLFCFVASLISILIAVGIAMLIKERSVQGEFAQAAYRSSSALLGCAFIQNIYGQAGPSALMIIGAVPLYNIAAVVILNLLKPNRGYINQETIKKTLKGVITNPIIIGIIVGLIWSLLKIPQTVILQKTVSCVATLATPMGLMALGASFNIHKAGKNIHLAFGCVFLKLIGFAAVFLPIAVWMGFRKEKLVAILVMLGAATTVSCFVMARNLDHEGILTSSTVMLTTLLSAFTLTMWLFVLKTAELI
ncbi:AEC family transporter [Cellulosilyticum ruminicola]|uniref:AEC family transporter n=1 Tax=Cellulosilyticum ruminicola TaxID=425254 RepID=UPI0006CF5D5E|nr:AEC family transporter [Cellulosilyticum ruminicola]